MAKGDDIPGVPQLWKAIQIVQNLRDGKMPEAYEEAMKLTAEDMTDLSDLYSNVVDDSEGVRWNWVQEGVRVKLLERPEEGFYEEEGTITEVTNRCILVTVDAKYRRSKGDDGLREVTLDQLEKL